MNAIVKTSGCSMKRVQNTMKGVTTAMPGGIETVKFSSAPRPKLWHVKPLIHIVNRMR